jgi:hypothetical protein
VYSGGSALCQLAATDTGWECYTDGALEPWRKLQIPSKACAPRLPKGPIVIVVTTPLEPSVAGLISAH